MIQHDSVLNVYNNLRTLAHLQQLKQAHHLLPEARGHQHIALGGVA